MTPSGARRLLLETLGDLRRTGIMLEFTCPRCAVTRLFDPCVLPFGDLQGIATVGRRMHCSFCGSEGDGAFTRPAMAARSRADYVVDL
jgi:hypothetical protein